jgi:predicted amidohydrolase
MALLDRRLCVAIGHFNPRLGDVRGNTEEVIRLSRAAAEQGAELVLFPEGCLTGNALRDISRQALLPAEPSAFTALRQTAVGQGIAICAGFAAPVAGSANIVHAIALPDGQVLFQRKAFRTAQEAAFLIPWPDPARTVFAVQGVRAVVVICSEYGAPAVERELAAVRPDLILHPSAGRMTEAHILRPGVDRSTAAAGMAAECRAVIEGASKEVAQRGIPKLGANPLGFDGETWWPGNSFIIEGDGRVAAWLPGENDPARMAPAIAVAEVTIRGVDGDLPQRR